MTCSISKGLVIHHGSLESEINEISSLTVRFWSNIERVVIIKHLSMLTVIMRTIIIYCIKACNNVQRENNVLQNSYPWHRHKIGIRYHFVCFSCLTIGDHDPRWRRIWRTWCVKLILECCETYAFLTIVISKSLRHKYRYCLCFRYLYNFPEGLFDIC
jgi:hypothetical protein